MASETSKSLVADYDSSSEDDDKPCLEPGKENHAVPLVSASEILDNNSKDFSNSVFINPYQVAESYEQSVLEKHVKMTQIKEPELKNKKICFKFSKGKCRLGDRCNYWHHSPIPSNDSDRRISDEEETTENTKEKSKKRCGLKDNLVPPKKYMKLFNKHK